MSQILYHTAFLFAIYAFLGWCTEVIYAGVNSGKYVNRGFLAGPVCPIYGVGINTVFICLLPFDNNFLLVFLFAVILTSVLEYITGYILEKVFYKKWWDYSDEPFNLKGYICLKFSLIWGIACVLIVFVIQPAITGVIKIIPSLLGIIILIIFYSIFILDCYSTISTMLNIKKRLKIIYIIEDKLKEETDEIGENILDGVNILVKVTEKGKQELNEFKDKQSEELNELKEKYENLVRFGNGGFERIRKAFPKLELKKNNEVIEKLKIYLKK